MKKINSEKNHTQLVYLYCQNCKSYGLDVIINNFEKVMGNYGCSIQCVYSLENIPEDAMVIPHTLDQSYDLCKLNFNTDVCLLMDALTLGYWNKFVFFLKKGYFFKYSFWYSLAAYFFNIYREIKVVRSYNKVMLVSQTDIDYLKRFARKETKFYCVPNGINIGTITAKIKSNTIRLGILSSWNSITSAQENEWFIKEYFKRYVRNHNSVKLYLAGRGPYINEYEGQEGIHILGEVYDLNDFFSNIDVFIVANPKGCGILNRVLDAFAHKTIVLGYEKAFSGFKYMKDCYLSFSNYDSFEKQIEYVQNNPEIVAQYIDNAYVTIIKENNWAENYSNFIEKAFL